MSTSEDFFKDLNEKRKIENSPTPDIQIICPNCKKKAAFFANNLVGSYVIRPSRDGKVSCLNCGVNRKFYFTNKDYYYKIEIGKRFIYAQTFEYLKFLKEYFEKDKRRTDDFELDFPKLFYKRKFEIIKKLNKLIESEERI